MTWSAVDTLYAYSHCSFWTNSKKLLEVLVLSKSATEILGRNSGVIKLTTNDRHTRIWRLFILLDTFVQRAKVEPSFNVVLQFKRPKVKLAFTGLLRVLGTHMTTFFASKTLFIRIAVLNVCRVLYFTVGVWCGLNSRWILGFLIPKIFLLLLVLCTQVFLAILSLEVRDWRLITSTLLRDNLLLDFKFHNFSLTPFVGFKLLE